MQKKTMCAVVLGFAAVVSAGTAKAQSDTDKQFITSAAQSDYTEITFSKLALQKSTNPAVKKYAAKMIADHNKLETEMKPFADKNGVAPVTALDSDHQQKYDQLSSMSGADFDKMYMAGMDTDHHKALDLFKAEASATTDNSFKPVVLKGEKVVAQHTEMADKMNAKMGGTAAGM